MAAPTILILDADTKAFAAELQSKADTFAATPALKSNVIPGNSSATTMTEHNSTTDPNNQYTTLGGHVMSQTIIQAPTSYTGAARRIWRLTNIGHPAVKLVTVPAALILTAVAFVGVTIWYCIFSVLVIPFRVLRRGDRKAKLQAEQHAEVLAAIHHTSQGVNQ